MDLDHRLAVGLVIHAAAPKPDVEVSKIEREKSIRLTPHSVFDYVLSILT